MELEFDKYCVLDGSPTTVLPSPRHRPKSERRKSKGKSSSKCSKEVLCVGDDFTEIRFHRYRSVSYKDVPSRKLHLEGNSDILKRVSVYQSSKDFRHIAESDAVEERRKIEFSCGSDTAFSFGILDAICSSGEEKVDSSMGSSSNSDDRENRSAQISSNIMSQSVVDHIHELHRLSERNPPVPLPKSLSAKLVLPHSPVRSESDSSRCSSQKTRFSPIRKLLDPFGKSKSLKSPLSYNIEPDRENKNGGALPKSLLHDFSRMADPNLQSLPAHLHGLLRLNKKNGLPFFEFLVKFPEDSFVAKTKKVENTLNWVYTFHSLHHKRRSTREPSLAGQMQVSCYLCTDLKNSGDCDNSMVTEFVLYDTPHSRKRVFCQDSCSSSPRVEANCESEEFPDKPKSQVEIAAISIELPFEKRESLKFRSEDATNTDKPLPCLLDLSLAEKRIGYSNTLSSPVKVNVVIPSGHHGFPTTEGPGPSPLLDRWRMGGGCDCGGWDMACPLHIFGNPNIDNRPLVENQQPLELFIQGRKEKAPALSMSLKEDGNYSVDFHAQLSALQAFSICVAILHSNETSIAVGQDNNVESLQSNTRRLFVKQQKLDKKVEQQQVFPSFVLNPPFSPIGRV